MSIGFRMKKLAVFFPGIGYTTDKPLLYFGRRLCEQAGYDIKLLSFSGFPQNVRNDEGKLRECFRIAAEQSAEALNGLDLSAYSEILFVSKSIGTVAAVSVAKLPPFCGRVRHVLFTPLEETFNYDIGSAIVFTGTDDQWVGGKATSIQSICKSRGIQCSVIPVANHSLETGDAIRDIETLRNVMETVKGFVSSREGLI